MARQKIIAAARAGEDLDPDKARCVRVIAYEVPDRAGDGKGELIALVTTITDPLEASAAARGALSPTVSSSDFSVSAVSNSSTSPRSTESSPQTCSAASRLAP